MPHSIVFTGGGTAGHVTPNLAIIALLAKEGWQVAYIGSTDGIEKGMVQAKGIPYYAVTSGKLRRYFSLQNFLDPFKILWGIVQSTVLFFKLKPDVVFSKGGFVAFPVVVSAWLHRIPVVAHESDLTPGLANRLSFPFVKKICLPLADLKKHFKDGTKIAVTGTPVRQELFAGNATRGLALCGFDASKPCILVMGGSLGAGSINRSVRDALRQLLQSYQIIHLCGKAKVDPALQQVAGYCQFEYVDTELADLFAASSLVISRSGANSLYEILALAKPHVLIPLSARISRGDQIQNARYFQKAGISVVVQDEDLCAETLVLALEELQSKHDDILQKIKALPLGAAAEKIVEIIKSQVH